MHASSVVQYTKPTVILKNDLVLLKFTFIFIHGCKWIFGVAATVIFTGKSLQKWLDGHRSTNKLALCNVILHNAATNRGWRLFH